MVFLVNSVYVKTVQKSPVFISERSLVLDADNYEWAFPLCECPVTCSKLCGRVLSWVVVGTAGRPAFQVPTNKYLQRSPQGPHIPRISRGGPTGNYWSGRTSRRTRNWEICFRKKKSGCRVPVLSRRESPTMQTSRTQDRGDCGFPV